MVGRELVGPPDRRVPYVFTGPLDQGPDIADAYGVGHRPAAAAGDVDRRGVGEDTAAPIIEVVIDAERPAAGSYDVDASFMSLGMIAASTPYDLVWAVPE